ncbi:transglycosylase family protein [Streptomyces sp. HNM0574]|uniref:transglycosylase family protein n=1 Tax=Streptomyces sp. HNM0574 TaxID=2714954 RepID=UPI00146B2703|nr:transglycosylase family protein [Streptomyces sp. HNM0574]NLU69191.1 peptidoglycan DD-metalloendopeptidase family protein [Streptomyces sp. HNM0574]
MSRLGQQRRHANNRTARRISRASLVLTVGGAGIALPLMGAGSAQAASVDTWDKVAQCESGGDWSINTGNGFSGGLQFTQSTWAGHGGTQYAPSADQATKDQQIAVAEKVLASQGPTAWPNCGPKAGLTQNSGSPDVNPDGQADSGAQQEQAPAPKKAEPEQKPAPKQQGGTTTYKVVRGDTLAKIADAEHVDGGWKKLYETNRDTVGGNPDVIIPGQKLSLSAKAESGVAPQGGAEKTAKTEKPAKKAAPRQESNASGFVAPVDSGTSTPYGASGGSWSSGSHTGVDFSASSGTPVKAVTSGTVVNAGDGGAYGNQVVIRHDDGKFSQYGHLTSSSVQVGQKVDAGDRIGLSGSTGNSTGPHLHFEIRTGPDYGSDIDPVQYLKQNGVAL